MNLYHEFKAALEGGALADNPTKKIIFTCRTCGKVRTCEYTQYQDAPNHTCWLRFDPVCLGTPESDLRCSCKSMKVKASEVIAIRTNHACTEECRQAKSSVCRCSCGGLHHAELYKIA